MARQQIGDPLEPIRQLHDRADNAYCTFEDEDRLARVTVGQVGELTELWLHPDTARLDAHEVAELVMDNYRVAADHMRREVLSRFGEAYGLEWTPADLAAGRISARDLLESLRYQR